MIDRNWLLNKLYEAVEEFSKDGQRKFVQYFMVTRDIAPLVTLGERKHLEEYAKTLEVQVRWN